MEPQTPNAPQESNNVNTTPQPAMPGTGNNGDGAIYPPNVGVPLPQQNSNTVNTGTQPTTTVPGEPPHTPPEPAIANSAPAPVIISPSGVPPAQGPTTTTPAPLVTGTVTPPVAPQGFVSGQPVIMGYNDSTGRQKRKLFSLQMPPHQRKKVAIASMSAVGVAVLVAGLVFGLYLPNTPTGVWKTSMSRTGKQTSALIEKLSDPKMAAQLEKTQVSIDGSWTSDGKKIGTITLDSTTDKTKTNNSANLTVNGSDYPNINLTADIKTQLPENALLPNIYFKIGGFSQLGLDSYMPGINAYDNKWIAVEQDYLKQFQDELSSDSSDTSKNLTQEDVVSIAKDVNTVTQEYVFSTDQEKAVLQMKEFVATEKSEGITANRYKATINKDNLQAYCVALGTTLAKNEAVKSNKLMDNVSETDIKDDCKNTAKDIKSSETYDIWIDKKYKLFHKIRVNENLEEKAQKIGEDKENCLRNFQENPDYDGLASDAYCSYNDDMIETGKAYTEFGQIYKGDDVFVLFADAVRDTNKADNSMRFDTTIDVKAYTMNGKLAIDMKMGGKPQKGELTITTKPFNGEVDADKPAGAIPIQQVIDSLMPDGTVRTSGSRLLPKFDWLNLL